MFFPLGGAFRRAERTPKDGSPINAELRRRAITSFHDLDSNDDGHVTRAELIRALRLPKNSYLCELLGLPAHIHQEGDGSHEQFERVFQAIDARDDKWITLKSWVDFFIAHAAQTSSSPAATSSATERLANIYDLEVGRLLLRVVCRKDVITQKVSHSDNRSPLQFAAVASPLDASLRVELGQAFARAGDIDSARAAYEEALEIKPNYARAEKCLARLPSLLLANESDSSGPPSPSSSFRCFPRRSSSPPLLANSDDDGTTHPSSEGFRDRDARTFASDSSGAESMGVDPDEHYAQVRRRESARMQVMAAVDLRAVVEFEQNPPTMHAPSRKEEAASRAEVADFTGKTEVSEKGQPQLNATSGGANVQAKHNLTVAEEKKRRSKVARALREKALARKEAITAAEDDAIVGVDTEDLGAIEVQRRHAATEAAATEAAAGGAAATEAAAAEAAAAEAAAAEAAAAVAAAAEAEARVKAEAKARAKAEAEAKAKAEAEARANAEAKAKTKAEAEARAKAEVEARAKAEAEAAEAAAAVAEAKAKAKAEAAAAEAAEAEAQAKAEAAAAEASVAEAEAAQKIAQQQQRLTESQPPPPLSRPWDQSQVMLPPSSSPQLSPSLPQLPQLRQRAQRQYLPPRQKPLLQPPPRSNVKGVENADDKVVEADEDEESTGNYDAAWTLVGLTSSAIATTADVTKKAHASIADLAGITNDAVVTTTGIFNSAASTLVGLTNGSANDDADELASDDESSVYPICNHPHHRALQRENDALRAEMQRLRARLASSDGGEAAAPLRRSSSLPPPSSSMQSSRAPLKTRVVEGRVALAQVCEGGFCLFDAPIATKWSNVYCLVVLIGTCRTCTEKVTSCIRTATIVGA